MLLFTALPPYRLTAQERLQVPQAVQERDPTTARDDAEIVKYVEHKIKCTCGCNLDVFTCRTTDFTCTTSPAMHRLVMARLDSSMTAEQVVAAFEAQYGQSVLMQPPRRGFNWAAYVMPFVGLGAGLVLLTALMRRWTVRTVETAETVKTVETVNTADLDRLKRELEHFQS